MSEIEKKTVFATALSADGKPLILLGIPRGAWEYMRHGKTNHFDFTAAGIGVQLVMFGGPTHASVLATVKGMCVAEGCAPRDETYRDAGFGIVPPKPKD